MGDWVEEVVSCLWPQGRQRTVWMIVDAARDRRAYRLLLHGFYSDRTCLFSGPLTPEMELAAPYLVQLNPDDESTRKLIRAGWGQSWGIFLAGEVSLVSLRRHLRSLLIVRDQSGRKLLFRFWDPRVMRLYLPTCRTEELRQVFGPVQEILAEDGAGEKMLAFAIERGALRQRATPLNPPAAGEATGS